MFNGLKKGSKLSEAAMCWALLQTLKREGITKKLHLHSLCHSFASHHVSLGTSLLHIQQLLGHETIQTTLIYHATGLISKFKISSLR
nr:tyrosine-type recombinase/integrase [Bacteroidota bacterium]